MEILHIESSGNQRFIFATNKLRENVGASELIHSIGRFADEAARRASPACRPIIATSGKATILAPDRATAEGIVRDVTRRALETAPGVEVHGAITSFDPSSEHLRDALSRLRDRHEHLRGTIPPPAVRFLRLPCFADCSTSGLPAAVPDSRFHGVADSRGAGDLRSRVSQAKWLAAEAGLKRLSAAAGDVPVMRSIKELDDLEDDDIDWFAVIHADGNGLGQLLMNFHEIVDRKAPQGGWEAHVDLLGRFSRGLEECTTAAFQVAVAKAWANWHGSKAGSRRPHLPLVPLVLGGDDLTVVCAGRFAVQFARDYLLAFEEETSRGIVGELSGLRPGAEAAGLSACAGIAIIKPHFPFHSAYELAEDLLASAKQVKRLQPDRPWSALDYHVLYDSSDASLERIRAALTLDDGATSLTSRPYVVTPGLDDHPWASRRTCERLAARIGAVTARDSAGRRKLPNSVLHDLREAMFLGRAAAEARLGLVLARHPAARFGDLLSGNHLFREEATADGRTIHHATLLDAMELDGFWSESAAAPEQPNA